MECGERPAAQVLAAPEPLRSRQWLLCGMHLYLATRRCWPDSDRSPCRCPRHFCRREHPLWGSFLRSVRTIVTKAWIAPLL